MKKSGMSPGQILEDLVERSFTVFSRGGKPGDYILRLGPVKRMFLKRLKSKDIRDIRFGR